MSGQWVFIEASDVWLFRDNKPFTAQQNFVARGYFPPTPMTLQGALRTHLLETALQAEGRTWADYRAGRVSDRLAEQLGLPQIGQRSASMGSIHFTGPWVARMLSDGQVEPLFKAPLDLLSNAAHQYRLLTPTDHVDFDTDPPFSGWRPLTRGEADFKESAGWLSSRQFEQYLKGSLKNFGELIPEETLFQAESRIGLALDPKRRTHMESMLYRAEFTRPCDSIGLLVHISDAQMPSARGVMSLGGEARTGRYRTVSMNASLPQTGRGRVRVVLLTPAFFSGGWQPGTGDWAPWVGGGRLVSVVVGKPLSISGWDLAHNQPKPLRHYVPAGSVFYFEDASITGQPFTETPSQTPDHAAMGFGSFAVGSW